MSNNKLYTYEEVAALTETSYPTIARKVMHFSEEEEAKYIVKEKTLKGRDKRLIKQEYVDLLLQSKKAKDDNKSIGESERKAEKKHFDHKKELVTEANKHTQLTIVKQQNELTKEALDQFKSGNKHTKRLTIIIILLLIVIIIAIVITGIMYRKELINRYETENQSNTENLNKIHESKIEVLNSKIVFTKKMYESEVEKLNTKISTDQKLYDSQIINLKTKLEYLEKEKNQLEHNLYADTGRVSKTEKGSKSFF